MAFSQRIEYIIKPLSKAVFAKKLGIHVSTIAIWDSDHLPKGDILKRIHEKFGVNIDWLLTGQGEPYIKDVGAKIEGGGLEALDSEGLWGKTEKHEFEGAHFDVTTFKPEEGLGSAVDKLARILSSGNQVLIRAILSNLEAFSRSADQEDRAVERIVTLEKECETLKSRVEALEESLTPEGPGALKKASTG